MKILLTILIILVFCMSCVFEKQGEGNNSASRKHITFVENMNESSVAYSDEGHIIEYKKDSIGNFIVLFVKFEDAYGKYGLKRIEEKIIRVEIDSSLDTLKSFLTIHGGAFCEKNNEANYDVFYFDERMNGDIKENIRTHYDSKQSECVGKEYEIKRIIMLLNIAYEIAYYITNSNTIIREWNNIAQALEPVQDLTDYNVMTNNIIYSSKVKKHILRIRNMEEELTYLHSIMREKKYD